MEKVVLRFNSGATLKGKLLDFSLKSESLFFKKISEKDKTVIDIKELKAIFFVKSFKGNINYREHKAYTATSTRNKKIFVKFKDGESLTGYLEGPIPWEKGFFLSGKEVKLKGFFVLPADKGSNNSKIFIINSSVRDVTVVPF
jgi:small nuclear ribonucleoprotein (snRNP)-like protein